ncbi:MAG TPA: CHRD domain-containing protein [Mesorhizobium sp.]|jgi:hypothetical protein|nr:CHRD domain-containing protein [Mesorhizobium sp.]
MLKWLSATAAIGALLTATALAQTTSGGTSAMTEQDLQELENVFEQAGFTDFQPVAGASVFRGVSGEGDSAVIAVAPDEMGATGGATGNSAGMTGAQVFRVTTAEGRSLFIVVAPQMAGSTGGGTTAGATDTSGSGTSGDSTAGDTTGGATTESDATGGATTGDGTTAGTTDDDTPEASAQAETMNFETELTGEQEVPPVTTSAKGELAVTYDSSSQMLSWKGTVSDLSGEVTGAHFHGPAKPGENADVLVPAPDVQVGEFEGSATLTDEQAKALMDGQIYFNVHTEANPKGELRGQIVE